MEQLNMMISSYVSQTHSSSIDFWYLPIPKKFTKPKYNLGQRVFHRITQREGEILHPVEVTALSWTGADWEYGVDFPKDHPQFKSGDIEGDYVCEWQLEAM